MCGQVTPLRSGKSEDSRFLSVVGDGLPMQLQRKLISPHQPSLQRRKTVGSGGLFLRKLRARVADEPTGFVWVERGKLAGSGYPASRKQLDWIAAQGIDVLLTLTEKPLPAELTDGIKMEFVHLSMPDHGVPEPSILDQGAKLVQTHIGEGKNVLVHCLAGEGRTGCVLAAYLILTRRIGGDEAMTILRDIKPSFVERQQEAAVRSYAEEVERRPLGS